MVEASKSRNGGNARWPCYHCHMARHTAPATGSSSPDLGGAASILRLRATSLAELRDSVRSGLPFSALVALTKQLEISPQQFTAVFGIPPRTVARRKEARHLNPQESDRLYRVARAVSQAVEVLGSIEKARVWLKTPNRALGREIPLDLLDTEIGARQVEEVLLRLNYGIFS
jgi:putative toxin-antitoxin system antitoxin component (TIGR02293 family)